MSLIKEVNEESIFKTKFTTSGSLVMILLTATLVLLGERILYDVARAFTADTIGSFGYFTNGQAIFSHVLVVFPVLIFTFLLNYFLGQKKQKYAIIIFPYFVTSIILAIQLALELGWFFTLNHNNLQFYTVMSLLVLTTSFAIYVIQKNYKTEKQNKIDNTMFFAGLLLFGLFTFIILGFEQKQQAVIFPTNSPASELAVGDRRDIQSGAINNPRIMYWYGKVNQHWDVDRMRWETDPDGVSGANIDKVAYCNKFYPGTTHVAPYAVETIDTWRAAGNTGAYTASMTADLCIQAN